MSLENSVGAYAKSSISLYPNMDTFEPSVGFRLSTFFLNNSAFDVFIVNQINLATKVPKQCYNNGKKDCVIIRKIYEFRDIQNVVQALDSINRLSKKFTKIPTELKVLGDALLQKYNRNQQTQQFGAVSPTIVTIDRCIDIQQIREQRWVYCEEDDLLIHFDVFDVEKPHPRSQLAKMIEGYFRIVERHQYSGVFVEIVDNDKEVGSRFMYAAKNLVEIPVTRDSSREAGVYFNRCEVDRFGELSLYPEHCELAEAAERFGIFASKEEALTGGSPELNRRELIERLEAENLRAKSETMQLKEQQQQAELRRKAELDAVKHQNDLTLSRVQMELEGSKADTLRLQRELDTMKVIAAKDLHVEERATEVEKRKSDKKKRKGDNYKTKAEIERMILADHYERESMRRKDNSEALKTGLLVVTTGISLFAIYQKATKG